MTWSIYFRFGSHVDGDCQSRMVCQFSAECVLPFDRYAMWKVTETSPSGIKSRYLHVLIAVQKRLTISTQNFVYFETTARATFLTSFVPILHTT